MEKTSVGIKEQQGWGRLIDIHNIKLPKDNEEILDIETSLSAAQQICETIINQQESNNTSNDESFYQELEECLLNLPPLETMDNPTTINNFVNHQATNWPLQNKIMLDPEHYHNREIEQFEVIHTLSPDLNGQQIWKIVIPSTLLPQLLIWYHLVLGHCGQQQL